MNETITLTKTALVNLLDTISDVRTIRDFSWVYLNPQPLPPIAGPLPDPWTSAFVARSVIDQAIAQYHTVEQLPAEQAESGFAVVRSAINEFVLRWCDNEPPPPPPFSVPWPFPPKFDTAQLRPVDLLVAGVQFQRAADFGSEHPLQADFSAAADQLLETGLQRLENG